MSKATVRAAEKRVIEAPIRAELRRAIEKFPTWPTDPFHALAVVLEELGEVAKAMLHVTYEPGKSTRKDVAEEVVQTAAMAIRLHASLGRYRFRKSPQHRQGRTLQRAKEKTK